MQGERASSANSDRWSAPRAVLALLAVACGAATPPPSQHVKAYDPFVVEVGASTATLFAAVRLHAARHGWATVTDDEIQGRFEAVTATTSADGMTTRRRWIASWEKNELTLRLVLEYRDSDSWVSSNLVHVSYGYHREREHVRQITRLLSAAPELGARRANRLTVSSSPAR